MVWIKQILLILSISCSLGEDLLSKFIQNDYKIKDYRGEVESYNASIVKYIKYGTFKHNRTTAAFNFSVTFLIDVGDKIEMVVQAYKFASNEYRHFPMRFQVNARKAFDADVGGIQSSKNCGNMKTMYFVKDVDYNYCNFVPDERKFPPFFPSGRYKLLAYFTYNNKEAFVINFCAEVYRPLAIPTKIVKKTHLKPRDVVLKNYCRYPDKNVCSPVNLDIRRCIKSQQAENQ